MGWFCKDTIGLLIAGSTVPDPLNKQLANFEIFLHVHVHASFSCRKRSNPLERGKEVTSHAVVAMRASVGSCFCELPKVILTIATILSGHHSLDVVVSCFASSHDNIT